ncbi:hypothetical protein UA08_04211 [Talaromyces atroroseus]|uniref:SnoaL-like domain-containing protein n=1 Tax=Talaromyces atroroseus TaxID=1441469 RepID=A0A1Q5Q8S7_TALAT|nr:hypothetical protein UA08_04211 [Talaromyces atroroseus]OKL60472.1 hypothetical protein UA08_04211 [Talaromyces atroroseus]
MPPTSINTSTLSSFITSFFTTSDTPTAHEKYAREYFTADATLTMGGKRADGFDEILSLRKSLWTSISSRKHTVSKIFFGAENDAMLYGRVAYVMKGEAGMEVEIDWAARAEFVIDSSSSSPKMRFYQVYLDTAAQQAAAAAAARHK